VCVCSGYTAMHLVHHAVDKMPAEFVSYSLIFSHLSDIVSKQHSVCYIAEFSATEMYAMHVVIHIQY